MISGVMPAPLVFLSAAKKPSRVYSDAGSTAALSSSPLLSETALDEEADGTAWARGAAAAALKELYGAPWSTTGPARPRNSTAETGREAE
jgi:hypothetical protein